MTEEVAAMYNGPEPSSFIVADDHPLVRQGVRMILETEFPGTRVTDAADLDSVLAAVVEQPGAILLIDLDMPGMDGVESLGALRQSFPLLRMAVLSGNADRATVADALNAGVNGYILKAGPPDELLYAISTIQGGRVYLATVLSKFSGKAALPAAWRCSVIYVLPPSARLESRSHTATTRARSSFSTFPRSLRPCRPQPICATWIRLLGASAPKTRNMRISAGVSYVGPRSPA